MTGVCTQGYVGSYDTGREVAAASVTTATTASCAQDDEEGAWPPPLCMCSACAFCLFHVGDSAELERVAGDVEFARAVELEAREADMCSQQRWRQAVERLAVGERARRERDDEDRLDCDAYLFEIDANVEYALVGVAAAVAATEDDGQLPLRFSSSRGAVNLRAYQRWVLIPV